MDPPNLYPKEKLKGHNFDFSFAFLERSFSDATLILVTHPNESQEGTDEGGAELAGERGEEKESGAGEEESEKWETEERGISSNLLTFLTSCDSSEGEALSSSKDFLNHAPASSPFPSPSPSLSPAPPLSLSPSFSSLNVSEPSGVSEKDTLLPTHSHSHPPTQFVSGPALSPPLSTSKYASLPAPCPSLSSSREGMIEVPVSAIVLASKSNYFLKLFTSGMSESREWNRVEIHLTEQEVPLMMEMLSFIYKGHTAPHISESFRHTLHLLVLTDRFGVEECFHACRDRLNYFLQKVTYKEALLFLELPKLIQELPSLRTLSLVAQACLAEHYGPLVSFSSNPDSREFLEFLTLPKSGLELLLKTDNLDVESEEVVFWSVILWARHNFTDLETRTRVLSSLLTEIRFPWMSASFIRDKVMSAVELQTDNFKDILVSCLLFKSSENDEDLGFQKSILDQSLGWSKPRRNYRAPLKSAFFDIWYSYCKVWQPNAGFQATSGSFNIRGKWFTLNAKLEMQKEGGPRFGLFLRLEKQMTFPRGEAEGEVHCDYQFCIKLGSCPGTSEKACSFEKSGSSEKSGSAENSDTGSIEKISSFEKLGRAEKLGGPEKSSCPAPGIERKKFEVVKSRSSCVFAPPTSLGWGSRDLLKRPWTEVLAQHDVYFPNGAMQLRVDLWMDDDHPIVLLD